MKKVAKVVGILQKQKPVQTQVVINQKSVKEQIDEAEKLFSEKKYQNSIRIFDDLIGFYDSEIVVSKFFMPETELLLQKYLVNVHKKGFSKSNLTSLLFSLFIKHESFNEMNKFISCIEQAQLANKQVATSGAKDENLVQEKDTSILNGFDADAAISVLIKNGFSEAANRIATSTVVSEYMIEKMIKDGNFVEAATKIFDFANEKTCKNILFKYGPCLLRNDESAAHIVSLTASMIFKKTPNDNEEDYIKLFWGFPNHMVSFIKDAVVDSPAPKLVTIYIELLIPYKGKKDPFFGNRSVADEKKALELIRNTNLTFQENHILNVCTERKFIPGFLAMMSRLNRSDEALQYVINSNLIKSSTCLEVIDWAMNENSDDLSSEMWSNLLSLFVEESKWEQIKETDAVLPFMKKAVRKSLDCRTTSWVSNTLAKNGSLPTEIIKESTLSAIQSLTEESRRQKKENETNY